MTEYDVTIHGFKSSASKRVLIIDDCDTKPKSLMIATLYNSDGGIEWTEIIDESIQYHADNNDFIFFNGGVLVEALEDLQQKQKHPPRSFINCGKGGKRKQW